MKVLALAVVSLAACSSGDHGEHEEVDAATATNSDATASDSLDVVDTRAEDSPPPLTACPPDPLQSQGARCVAPLTCASPPVCCCESCRPITSCSCSSDGWMGCMIDDTCFFAGHTCSPGCTFDHVMTVEGCMRCDLAATRAEAALAELAASHGACGSASECALVPGVGCAARCGTAVAAGETEAFATAAAAFDAAECFDYPRVCEPGDACEIAVAACVEGTCRRVHPCAPGVADIGDACDDGDPCTDTSICNASRVCQGFARDCDDGNPCTIDTCERDVGCVHGAREGDCAAPGACGLGGVCVAGACRDTGPGFHVALGDGHTTAAGVAYDPVGEIVAVGTVHGEASARMWRQGVDGSAPASVSIPGVERAFDVVIVGGDRIVAGEVVGDAKTDVVVARVGRLGEARWSFVIPGPTYDTFPTLALGGDAHRLAVAWSADDGSRLRAALTDLDGAEPLVIDVGATAARLELWPAERPVVARDGAGFVTLRGDPARDGRLLATTISSQGARGDDVALAVGAGERARGLLVLDDGDRLVWTGGSASAVRRFEPAGGPGWTTSLAAVGAFVREGALVVVAGPPEAPALVTLDLATGAELARHPMPATPGPLVAAAPAGDGLAIVGRGPSTRAWLRVIAPWSACPAP
ncbi:MAG: hypothetical protein IT385_20885 [Deltaproteobacteria bacterium]|nr:hypothetical protein [Deltaproteobacteria bacterium]